MALYPKHPLVDVQNPCYCPALPARAYIHNLHQSFLPAGGFAPLGVVNHFTKVLAQCVATPGPALGDKGILDSDSEDSFSSGSSATTTTDTCSLSSAEEFHSAFSNPRALSNTTMTLIGSALPGFTLGLLDTTATTDNLSFDPDHLKRFTGLRDSHLLARPLRKRKSSSASVHSGQSGSSNAASDKSNLRGPSKRARSTPGSPERSFKVRLKRKILNFDVPSSTRPLDTITKKSPPPPKLEPYHPSSPAPFQVDSSTPPLRCVSETKRDLAEFIDDILVWEPDADIDPDWTVQESVDYLAEIGLIRGSLMKIMGKSSGLRNLSLTTSLGNIYSYHPSGVKEVLSELHTPGMFMGLVSLKIEFVPLTDDDVLYFHHLPGLQYLSLKDTCISNTAVYLLSSHRHTLLSLDIGYNWDINDDAIAPLLNFKKLKYLNMFGTDVTMDGLRRYAKVIHEARRVIHIDIPEECEETLQNLGHLYLVDIPPLFVSDPEALENLTLAEIRANLSAHWEVNKRIVTTGNKNDLRERLKELLERRKEDLLVKEMVENGRDDGAEFKDRGDAEGE